MNWFQFDTRSSSPYLVGERELTVHSWVLQILTPIGGLIWNYPIAVTVRSLTRATDEKRYSIFDLTRLAQLTFLGFVLLWTIFLWRKRA